MRHIKELVPLLKKGNIVAFCGAGLSSESSIPTFRGKGGLWEKYNPEVFATLGGLLSLFIFSPKKVRDFIVEFYDILLSGKPNYAHYGLAELERKNLLLGVITQNIDDFHSQAGSTEVAELHGNAYKFWCLKCKIVVKKNREEFEKFIENLKSKQSRKEIIREILNFMGKCPGCRKRMRPYIIFFGQSLPQDELKKGYSYLDKAQTLLCIGTSGVVYPAAYLPYYSRRRGAKIININPESTPLDDIADWVIRETAVNFFKIILPILNETFFRHRRIRFRRKV